MLRISTFTGALAYLALFNVAGAQEIPKYADLIRDSDKIRSQVFDLSQKIFYAVNLDKLSTLADECNLAKVKNTEFMNSFYSNTSYLYFMSKVPQNYSQQYLSNSVVALTRAMSSEQYALLALCDSASPSRTDAMLAMNFLSDAYNSADNARLWAELADLVK